ncbi:hypothetical protein [Rhizobium sp. 18055]|uniref:hypothetical protein n=1 Tax=Rhizobium sp. 18055 TaxID=2681403 RepID=UPI001FCE7CC4|nr:hypothetical protein [Rhizobium sp. 18055]
MAGNAGNTAKCCVPLARYLEYTKSEDREEIEADQFRGDGVPFRGFSTLWQGFGTSRTGYSSLNVLRVTIRNNAQILEQLAKLNIKSSTIYPGIEKATAEIARKHDREAE